MNMQVAHKFHQLVNNMIGSLTQEHVWFPYLLTYLEWEYSLINHNVNYAVGYHFPPIDSPNQAIIIQFWQIC